MVKISRNNGLGESFLFYTYLILLGENSMKSSNAKGKFLLLNSPLSWGRMIDNEEYLPPLGLGYIATYLDAIGVDVQIIDCVKRRMSVTEIITCINKEKPAYIGINIFTQNYKLVKYILENISTGCELFIGGQVVKSIYHEILKWDVKNKLNIIIGDGEYIIPKIVSKKCEQKPETQQGDKYVYRVDTVSKYFPNDISNVILNRKFFENEVIVNHYGKNEIAIVTSRGCSYNCAFCGGARGLNRDIPIRYRTAESVINEINEIVEHYPQVQSIRVLDDLFLRDITSIDTANAIFSGFPGLSWRGMSHVLSLKRAKDKFSELKKNGCDELFIGIESGSETIRRKINKSGKIDDIIDVAYGLLSHGIDLKGYFIYGFPEETEEDFRKTFTLAEKLTKVAKQTEGNFRTSVFQFRPYHGTQLYNEILKKQGFVPECEFNNSISHMSRRAQFNFDSGNYSNESDDILNKYIDKTLQLIEEKI